MKKMTLLLMLCLAGCVSTPTNSGVRFYNPATWFSTSEAKKAEKLDAKTQEARQNAIKEAQKTAHETSIAIEEIPASNAKETAQESNGQTVLILDQVAGPLTAKEVASIRRQVELLLSNNADLRQQGEVQRLKSRKAVEQLSQELEALKSKLERANQALPDALRREGALANKYRNLMFGLWALGLFAFVLCGALLYFKVVYGGVFSAVGKGLSGVYAAHPEQAQNIELLLSKHMSPAAVRKVLGHSA